MPLSLGTDQIKIAEPEGDEREQDEQQDRDDREALDESVRSSSRHYQRLVGAVGSFM